MGESGGGSSKRSIMWSKWDTGEEIAEGERRGGGKVTDEEENKVEREVGLWEDAWSFACASLRALAAAAVTEVCCVRNWKCCLYLKVCLS